MPRPQPITIPISTDDLQPDFTPPAPTGVAEEDVGTCSRKRVSRDGDDEILDLRREKSLALSPPEPVMSAVHPNAPLSTRGKRPRGDLPGDDDDMPLQCTLVTMLDGISLGAQNETDTTKSEHERARKNNRFERSLSWTASDLVQSSAAVPRHRSITPPSRISDAGKRRRSIPGNCGNCGMRRMKGHRSGRRGGDLSAVCACTCWAPPDGKNAETVVDWPPWAGDVPLGGQQAPIQAAVLDPRSHAREMMRATLRKRLTTIGGLQGLRMEQGSSTWHSGSSIAYGVDEDVLEYDCEDSEPHVDHAAEHLEGCMDQEMGGADLPQVNNLERKCCSSPGQHCLN